MDERQRRIGLNEAVFREVNERIEQLAGELELGGRPLELVCECGNATCTGQIRMTTAEYEAVRKDSALFAICPGHEIPDVEEVVEKHDDYHVVRKFSGDPQKLAKDTHPRS
jgi:hypothetical protein